MDGEQGKADSQGRQGEHILLPPEGEARGLQKQSGEEQQKEIDGDGCQEIPIDIFLQPGGDQLDLIEDKAHDDLQQGGGQDQSSQDLKMEGEPFPGNFFIFFPYLFQIGRSIQRHENDLLSVEVQLE